MLAKIISAAAQGVEPSLVEVEVMVVPIVLVIIFVLFGIPNQTPTIIGLAGAGLTVALKDFIVGFVGWFVLMGKNGLRVGDWVEINGVVGEVVEIGLLRTVLLETGNWADSGHPTGRKVAFVNSFAIEGHFFNFSTSGQWLWDEVQLMIPPGRDPHTVIENPSKVELRIARAWQPGLDAAITKVTRKCIQSPRMTARTAVDYVRVYCEGIPRRHTLRLVGLRELDTERHCATHRPFRQQGCVRVSIRIEGDPAVDCGQPYPVRSVTNLEKRRCSAIR
jgi:hypothetical protein